MKFDIIGVGNALVDETFYVDKQFVDSTDLFFNQFKGEKAPVTSKKLVSSFKAFVFRCRAQKVSLAPKSWNIHQEEQIDWLLTLVQQDPPKLSG